VQEVQLQAHVQQVEGEPKSQIRRHFKDDGSASIIMGFFTKENMGPKASILLSTQLGL